MKAGKRLRPIELMVLSELIKSSKRSDRELAKLLKVSQPTVTRIRAKLERKGYIESYSVMPSFQKLGYQMGAISFVKFKEGIESEEAEKLRKRAEQKFGDESFASNVVMFERGMGLGYTGVLISLHENYASYVKFIETIKQFPVLEPDIGSFLLDLKDRVHYRSVGFAPLAHHILTLRRDSKSSK